MANLLLRNLDAEVLARLRASARAQGRSLQAEIHAALGRASLASRAQTVGVAAMAAPPGGERTER